MLNQKLVEKEHMRGVVTLILIALLLLAAGVYVMFPSHTLTDTTKQAALEKSHAACLAALEVRAAELEDWYLEDKKHTQEMSQELNGWKSKWVMAKTTLNGNEQERKKFFQELSQSHLHSPRACQEKTAWIIAELLHDWIDVENLLAVELNRPDLGHVQQRVEMQGGEQMEVDQTSALQKQIAADIATLVGSEVAASCVTSLGASAGILGTGAVLSAQSFGISLAVGVVVELGVNWYLDTEGKLRQALDAQVEKKAAEQKEKFREVMRKALKNQMKQWEKQL